MLDSVKSKGYIRARITYKDTGRVENLQFDNIILNQGKEYLARCLLEEHPKLPIKFMLFGDGGTADGQPKEISPIQQGLHGVTRIKKQVVAQVDPEMPTQIIFTVIVGEEEGNNHALNEMGLQLSDGTLFNLSTFSDLNKTDQMEIVWSWFVCFV